MTTQIALPANIDSADLSKRVARYGGELVTDGITLIAFRTAPDALTAIIDRMAAGLGEPPTADDVRAEASRRMQELIGARDGDHLQIKIANASRAAIRLLNIKADRVWTQAEAATAEYLEHVDLSIEAIRKASNVLEANVPDDYGDDRWWP